MSHEISGGSGIMAAVELMRQDRVVGHEVGDKLTHSRRVLGSRSENQSPHSIFQQAASSRRGPIWRVASVSGSETDEEHTICKLQDGPSMRDKASRKQLQLQQQIFADQQRQRQDQMQQQQQQPLGRRGSRSSLGQVTMDYREKVVSNEPLVCGFALLRAVQLLNFDVYYINEHKKAHHRERDDDDVEAVVQRQRSFSSIGLPPIGNSNPLVSPEKYRTLLDDLASQNPLQHYIDKWPFLDACCQMLKICLSLLAITVTLGKTLATIVLCLITSFDSTIRKPEASDSNSMAVIVLLIMNLSLVYILCSTIFNGHLIWNLFSQRLFLVSRRFQYKTMFSLVLFVYLEYVVNISLINNLFEFSLASEEESRIAMDERLEPRLGSYYTLANLRAFVTEHDNENRGYDILLTCIQFARGIIRMSPYITINYAIICLKEHISIIRNQQLLTDSLKRRQKLRVVVVNRRANIRQSGKLLGSQGNILGSNSKKKRVIFAADGQQNSRQEINNQENNRNLANGLRDSARVSLATNALPSSVSPVSFGSGTSSAQASGATNIMSSSILESGNSSARMQNNHLSDSSKDDSRIESSASSEVAMKEENFLNRIGDFDELEAYITHLYIFTGRLNRLMSRQGLTMFFIVHNLIISTSLIIPEAVKGGIFMAHVIRILVIIIGIVPFVFGQSLNGQLEQLSKQIDRIIIQQQFISRRRDNLVKIRELLHDIRINCGGMLNFNVETGIKYLVVAFASAFFIEQEGEFLDPQVFVVLLKLN